jgi:hypothetical protein
MSLKELSTFCMKQSMNCIGIKWMASFLKFIFLKVYDTFK